MAAETDNLVCFVHCLFYLSSVTILVSLCFPFQYFHKWLETSAFLYYIEIIGTWSVDVYFFFYLDEDILKSSAQQAGGYTFGQ